MTAAPPVPKYLTTVQAAEWLAGRGVAVTAQTVRNWMSVGCVRQGRRVFLRHLRTRHLLTRRKWLREFLDAAQRVPPAMAADAPPPGRAETAAELAERGRQAKAEADAVLRRRPLPKKAR